MSAYKCIDCGDYVMGYGIKCSPCMKKTTKCTHPSDTVTGHWNYEGKRLISASGYCMLCGEPHVFCVKADKLVPKKKVKQTMPCVHCGQERR